MVKKYHPDRIRSKEKSLLKGAEEKFRQVQEAYEAIKKERNF
jgi:DnaJ like chaperone protein